jgi:hypothetical protein
MNVSFFLKQPKADTTVIFAHIGYAGLKVKYYLPDLKIAPKFWDTETQLAKPKREFPTHPEFNRRLKDWRRDIEKAVLNYQFSNGSRFPSPETLKAILHSLKKDLAPKSEPLTFLQ